MARSRWRVVVGMGVGLAVLAPALRYGTDRMALGVPAATAAEDRSGAPSAHPKAPDFKVVDPEGKPVTLSGLKGKVVILSFWATWCPPCRMELPHLDAIYKKYRGKPVQVLGVNLDKEGKDLRNWVKEQGLTLPVASDPGQKAAQAYEVGSIPTLLVIDQNGRIRERGEGFDPDMEKNIGRLVDGLLKK